LDRCKPKGGGNESAQPSVTEDDIDSYLDEYAVKTGSKAGYASLANLAGALGVSQNKVKEIANQSAKFDYVSGKGVRRL